MSNIKCHKVNIYEYFQYKMHKQIFDEPIVKYYILSTHTISCSNYITNIKQKHRRSKQVILLILQS